ncbi:hypothetical protein V2I01_24265 [Micromonospora sp. BRA006-A]|nr:hypothetical protein [Micromonospora sp. BRA006-A]
MVLVLCVGGGVAAYFATKDTVDGWSPPPRPGWSSRRRSAAGRRSPTRSCSPPRRR